jgi:hypothetical protein
VRTVKRAAALAAALSCLMAAAPPVLASPTTPTAPDAASPGEPRDPRPQRASRQSHNRSQVALTLTQVTPKTARDSGTGSKIEVKGTVENRSGAEISGLAVRFKYNGRPLTSRSQLAQYASSPPSQLTGSPGDKPLQQASAVNGKENFAVGYTTTAMGLRSFGVYPIGVEVVGNGQVLAGLTTFITFIPKGARITRTKVAWVMPLIDRMHRANDQTFLDDQLSADMTGTGRLNALVAAGERTKTPITWAIDPALMDDARTMASGDYTVRPPKAKGSRMKKSAAAQAWIDRLKRTVAGDGYFPTGYADPDTAALVRSDMPSQVKAAYRNTLVADQVVGKAPTRQMAWPVSGVAGQQSLDLLANTAKLGPNGAFLLTSKEFQEEHGPQNATTAVKTAEGTKKVAIYDEQINEVINENSKAPGAAPLIEQRFLAETAMINAESPETPRTIVVAPSRHWNPSPSLAQNLLTYTAKAKWLQSVPLDQILNAQPQERSFKGYLDGYQDLELGKLYLDEVKKIAKNARTFAGILDPVANVYERAVLRTESASWRQQSRRAKQARDEVGNELKADMSKVHVQLTEAHRVSLAGGSGKIGITVANDLPREQKVKLQFVVTSQSPGLQVGELAEQNQVFELRGGDKRTIPVPLKVNGNGNFKMHVQLRTAQTDADYGTGETVTVRSTRYGRVALLIIGGALAVIFVGVGARAMRARRRRKAEDAGDGSTGVGPAGTEPSGPTPPGAGSGGPGLPGERFSGDGSSPGTWQASGPGDGNSPAYGQPSEPRQPSASEQPPATGEPSPYGEPPTSGEYAAPRQPPSPGEYATPGEPSSPGEYPAPRQPSTPRQSPTYGEPPSGDGQAGRPGQAYDSGNGQASGSEPSTWRGGHQD